MKIEFKEPETFRDVRIETQAFDSFFRKEHDERRATKENPGGFHHQLLLLIEASNYK